MKNLLLIILAIFFATSCGDDDDGKELWECGCVMTCDGEDEGTGEIEECGTEKDIEKSESESKDECEDTLDALGCEESSCVCACIPQDESC